MAEKKEEMTPLKVLKTYFGYRSGEGIKEFAQELKALSTEEKHELAVGAAANLGVILAAPNQVQ
jgi:hypothetical protein